MNSSITFQNINFGMSDASTELSESPKLLREGYYDISSVEDKLDRHQHFLVLGYKGAGKSMVAARFDTLAQDSPSLYSYLSPVSLRDIALADLRRVVPESFEAPARAHWTWVLFLCVRLLEGLETDGQADDESRQRVAEALRILRSHSIISRSPRSLAKFKTTKMRTTLQLPKFAEQSWEFDQSTSDQTLNVWIAFMRTVLKSHVTSRRHYLFIDGLDDLGPLRDHHGTLLGGLMSAARDLNSELRREGANIKVVVCCRTDLYERLELPMKGKIRSDFGIDLDWYQDPREVERTHLVRLASQRAKLSGYRGEVFRRSFPSRLDGVPTTLFLTRATRHTPRDFHALLRNIQDSATGSEPLTRDQILTGARNYSLLYFRDEMDDALDSYFEPSTKQQVLDAIGRLRTATFSRNEFSQLIRTVDPDRALEALFECGFVGAVTEGGRAPYYRFSYRNPAVRIANLDKLQLHSGLWKAYNLA